MNMRMYKMKRIFYAESQQIKALREHFLGLSLLGARPVLWNPQRIHNEARCFLQSQMKLSATQRIETEELVAIAMQIGRWEATLECLTYVPRNPANQS